MTDQISRPLLTVDPLTDPGGEPYVDPQPSDPDVDPGAEPYRAPDIPDPDTDPEGQPPSVPDPDDPGASRHRFIRMARKPQPDPDFRQR